MVGVGIKHVDSISDPFTLSLMKVGPRERSHSPRASTLHIQRLAYILETKIKRQRTSSKRGRAQRGEAKAYSKQPSFSRGFTPPHTAKPTAKAL